PARHAGQIPAINATARIQNGVTTSDHQGKARRIVQPKKARLITPVSTNDNARPDANPITPPNIASIPVSQSQRRRICLALPPIARIIANSRERSVINVVIDNTIPVIATMTAIVLNTYVTAKV